MTMQFSGRVSFLFFSELYSLDDGAARSWHGAVLCLHTSRVTPVFGT